MRNNNTFAAYWSLRLLFGLVPIVAGLDKFLNLVTYWPKYLSSITADVVGIAGLTPQGFTHVVGVIEIVAGLIVLSKHVRFGAYLVSAWLLGIAANLLLAGYLDVAVRDVGLAVAAFALAKLEEARA